MASAPGHGHTSLGKYNARKTLEDEHRNGGHGPEGLNVSPDCKLCMSDYWDAKRVQTEGR